MDGTCLVTVGGVAGICHHRRHIQFRIWLWAQIERIREMWRSQKRLQADVKALQEQVAALMKLAETEDAMIDHIVSLEVGVKDIRATSRRWTSKRKRWTSVNGPVMRRPSCCSWS